MEIIGFMLQAMIWSLVAIGGTSIFFSAYLLYFRLSKRHWMMTSATVQGRSTDTKPTVKPSQLADVFNVFLASMGRAAADADDEYPLNQVNLDLSYEVEGVKY